MLAAKAGGAARLRLEYHVAAGGKKLRIGAATLPLDTVIAAGLRTAVNMQNQRQVFAGRAFGDGHPGWDFHAVAGLVFDEPPLRHAAGGQPAAAGDQRLDGFGFIVVQKILSGIGGGSGQQQQALALFLYNTDVVDVVFQCGIELSLQFFQISIKPFGHGHFRAVANAHQTLFFVAEQQAAFNVNQWVLKHQLTHFFADRVVFVDGHFVAADIGSHIKCGVVIVKRNRAHVIPRRHPPGAAALIQLLPFGIGAGAMPETNAGEGFVALARLVSHGYAWHLVAIQHPAPHVARAVKGQQGITAGDGVESK